MRTSTPSARPCDAPTLAPTRDQSARPRLGDRWHARTHARHPFPRRSGGARRRDAHGRQQQAVAVVVAPAPRLVAEHRFFTARSAVFSGRARAAGRGRVRGAALQPHHPRHDGGRRGVAGRERGCIHEEIEAQAYWPGVGVPHASCLHPAARTGERACVAAGVYGCVGTESCVSLRRGCQYIARMCST